METGECNETSQAPVRSVLVLPIDSRTDNYQLNDNALGPSFLSSFVPVNPESAKTGNVNLDGALVKFQKLVIGWRNERSAVSSLACDDFLCPSFQRLVAMGKEIIPLILSELREELSSGKEPDRWFGALWAINDGESPVPEEDAGDIFAMAKAWLKWGSLRGYIDGQGVGAVLP